MFLTVLFTLVALAVGFIIVLRLTLNLGKGPVADKTAQDYNKEMDFDNTSDETRIKNAGDNTNKYYDLVTDFYMWGWGNSFHFAPRAATESLEESVARHEYYLSNKLDLKPGMKVLDLGCGIGGPMQNIARFSGAQITGVNNHPYQIQVGRKGVEKNNLQDLCEFFKSDFMKVNKPDNSYDAAYAIEATCHAGDRVGCYREILRMLKPGSKFAAYEWCTTDKYDPKNPEHVEAIQNIIKGDGLPCVLSTDEVVQAMKDAGYENVESIDLVAPENLAHNPVPWYQPFVGLSIKSLRSLAQSQLGAFICHKFLTVMEMSKLLPDGSVKSYEVLIAASKGLRYGGEKHIFTPCFLVVGTKPQK